jgi:hypothetical protein
MPFVRVAQIDLERRFAKAEATGAIPVVDTSFKAPVPQQPQGGFRKPVFVGASPTRGSNLRLPATARQAISW